MKAEPESSASVRIDSGRPQTCYRQWRSGKEQPAGLLLVEFELEQYWLEGGGPKSLTAIYYRQGAEVRLAVTDCVLVTDNSSPGEQFSRWVAEHGLQVVSPGQPLPLLPCYIPKPWGQEIWYTGVEARGVCCFGESGAATPIPWIQAALPDSLAGRQGEPLILLKILDPVAQEVTGDLYFELHEEKREVYVVTRVDPRAWPGGVGYIRYGFDPNKLSAAGSDSQFREDYLSAVQAYESVRRELDSLPDRGRATVQQLESEQVLRKAMDEYTCMRPLEVGDVVVVPLLVPHSLQHGVRTVEFQTPVYERQILSFAQKVLTQDHWDTTEAAGQMRLTPPQPEPFEILQREPGLTVERIVDFPDFEVRRVRVKEGNALELPPLTDYGLVMVVEGELSVESAGFEPERALLLPVGWSGGLAPTGPGGDLVFLLALPRS